jgi:hypothetical protein
MTTPTTNLLFNRAWLTKDGKELRALETVTLENIESGEVSLNPRVAEQAGKTVEQVTEEIKSFLKLDLKKTWPTQK